MTQAVQKRCKVPVTQPYIGNQKPSLDLWEEIATLPVGQLLEGLKLLKDAILKSPRIPILANVHIESLNERLQLTATNMVVAKRTIVRLNQEPSIYGSLTIPLNLLLNMLKRSDPTETVELALRSDIAAPILRLSFKNFRRTTAQYLLNGMRAEDFPPLPDFEGEADRWVMQSEDLAKLSKRLLPFTSRDATRPDLNGLHLRIKDGKLDAIATDGKQVARTSCGVEGANGEFYLPSQLAIAAQKMRGTVHLRVAHRAVAIGSEQTLTICRTNGQQFLDTDDLFTHFEKRCKEAVVCDRVRLLRLVTRLQEIDPTRRGIKTLRITTDAASQRVRLEIPVAEAELREDLTAQVSRSVTQALDSRNLLRALQAISSTEVILKMNGRLKLVILPLGCEPIQQLIMGVKQPRSQRQKPAPIPASSTPEPAPKPPKVAPPKATPPKVAPPKATPPKATPPKATPPPKQKACTANVFFNERSVGLSIKGQVWEVKNPDPLWVDWLRSQVKVSTFSDGSWGTLRATVEQLNAIALQERITL